MTSTLLRRAGTRQGKTKNERRTVPDSRESIEPPARQQYGSEALIFRSAYLHLLAVLISNR